MAIRSRKWWIWVSVVAAVAVGGQVFPLDHLIGLIWKIIQVSGFWGTFLFLVAYVICCVFLIPVSLLTFGAGAAYGVMRGTLLVWIAATVGAWVGFWIARWLGREKISRFIRSDRRLKALDRAIAVEGWKIVFLCRLSPIFPFAVLNYLFGLTHVHPRHYLIASSLGVFLPNFLYVYIGYLAAKGISEKSVTVTHWILYILGCIATISVVIILTRMARQALAAYEKVEDPGSTFTRPDES